MLQEDSKNGPGGVVPSSETVQGQVSSPVERRVVASAAIADLEASLSGIDHTSEQEILRVAELHAERGDPSLAEASMMMGDEKVDALRYEKELWASKLAELLDEQEINRRTAEEKDRILAEKVQAYLAQQNSSRLSAPSQGHVGELESEGMVPPDVMARLEAEAMQEAIRNINQTNKAREEAIEKQITKAEQQEREASPAADTMATDQSGAVPEVDLVSGERLN